MSKKNNGTNVIDKKRLAKVAEELNELMGLNPKIDVKQDAEALQKEIIDVASDKEDGLKPDDMLSDATRATLTELGVIDAPAEAPEEVEKEIEKEPEVKKPAEKKGKAKKEEKKPAEKVVEEKKPKAAEKKEEKKAAVKTNKPDKKQTDVSKSNKAIVWKKWNAGTKDAEKLLTIVENRVKIGTIRGWVSAWGKGTNLPAIAKKNTA